MPPNENRCRFFYDEFTVKPGRDNRPGPRTRWVSNPPAPEGKKPMKRRGG